MILRLSSLLNRWVKAAAAFIVVIAAWAAFVYVSDWPITQYYGCNCEVCRAFKGITSWCLVPVSVKIKGNEFSQYYCRRVDAGHRHSWKFVYVDRRTRTGGISAHGGPNSLKLRYEAALGILKSLPDNRARRAFFGGLQVSDGSSPQAHKVFIAIERLNNAYDEDEDRKDWLVQLRRVGLYPEAGK